MASISLGGRLDDRDKYQSLSLLKSILSVPKLNWRKIVCAAQPFFSNIDAVPQPQLFLNKCEVFSTLVPIWYSKSLQHHSIINKILANFPATQILREINF